MIPEYTSCQEGCSGIPFFTVLMTVYRVIQWQATRSLHCHLKLASTLRVLFNCWISPWYSTAWNPSFLDSITFHHFNVSIIILTQISENHKRMSYFACAFVLQLILNNQYLFVLPAIDSWKFFSQINVLKYFSIP